MKKDKNVLDSGWISTRSHEGEAMATIPAQDLRDTLNYIKELEKELAMLRIEEKNPCKYVKRIGESCTLNDNCKYPHCK